MKIRSDIVGTTTPRANWNQSNHKKADYVIGKDSVDAAIKTAQETANNGVTAAGKAQTAANNAQTAANNAQTAANNAQAAADYAQATADSAMAAADAAERTAIVYAASLHLVKTINVPKGAWTSTAPYTITMQVDDILASDTPHYSVVYSSDAATRLLEKESFAMIDDLDTGKNSVTFTCFEERPEVTLKIQLEVNR